MQLSRSFSLAEMTISQTAARLGINNKPMPLHEMNLKRLCEQLLQPIRDHVGKPIHVSSGYRCKRVNDLIGSNDKSAHPHGFAADITSPAFGNPQKLALFIVEMLKRNNIRFDQVILEFGQWVHVAVCNREGLQRGQILTAKKINGQTKYVQGIV